MSLPKSCNQKQQKFITGKFNFIFPAGQIEITIKDMLIRLQMPFGDDETVIKYEENMKMSKYRWPQERI